MCRSGGDQRPATSDLQCVSNVIWGGGGGGGQPASQLGRSPSDDNETRRDSAVTADDAAAHRRGGDGVGGSAPRPRSRRGTAPSGMVRVGSLPTPRPLQRPRLVAALRSQQLHQVTVMKGREQKWALINPSRGCATQCSSAEYHGESLREHLVYTPAFCFGLKILRLNFGS